MKKQLTSSEMGKKGGASKSKKKILSSRLNGKKGGRPKKVPPEITLTSN
jgi:hypothetical protein